MMRAARWTDVDEFGVRTAKLRLSTSWRSSIRKCIAKNDKVGTNNQGPPLVHFSTQPEPFLTQNTPYRPPDAPSYPQIPPYTPRCPRKHALNNP